jgi:hypothetical protein
MRHSSHRGLALLLPAALFLTSARAQEIPSHEIDPDLLPSKNVSKLLDPKKLKGKNNFDVEMMRNLLKFMEDSGVDPNMINPKMVEQFLRDNPEFKNPENLKKLRDIAEEQKRVPRNPNDGKPVDWGGVQEQLKRIEEVRKNQRFDPMEMKDPDPRVRPPIDQPAPRPQANTPLPKKEDRESQDFNKWLMKNFGNSPEMKNMAKDFAKIWGDDKKKGGGGFLKDIQKEWKSITGSDSKSGGGSNLKDLTRNLKMPDTNSNSGGSGRNASSNNNSGGSSSGGGSDQSSSSSSGGSSWNFGGGGSGGGSSSAVVVLLVVVVCGLLLYLYYKRQPKPVEEVPADSVRIWPVDPLQVNSREDVVKAFEFLSISKCGHAAVNWHHLQIAGRMGKQEPEHKDAASRLARLYEKARYAPANELFDALDISEARARFSQLAGAPIA